MTRPPGRAVSAGQPNFTARKGIFAPFERLYRRHRRLYVAWFQLQEKGCTTLSDDLDTEHNNPARDYSVTNDDDVRSVFASLDRLDVLVLSAAVEVRKPLLDTTDEDWQRVLDVNLKGPFLCCKHGIPAIARTGGGSVVLLGSVLGAIGSPGYAAYCASKGALVNLAKQAAIEHAPDQVRVNVVSPSATDTGLFARVAARSDDPERMMQMVARNTPMQRLGTAAEVAATVAFLCSEGAGFISGTVIPLDGGMAARRIV